MGSALLAAWAVLAASASAVTRDEGVAPHAGIDGLYDRFAGAYAALDADALVELYTVDALYLPPKDTILQGRNAIRPGFAGMFERAGDQGVTLDITFRIVRRVLADRHGHDVGIYELLRRQEGEVMHVSHGKFVTVARRDPDGIWRFELDAYSSYPETEEAGEPAAGARPEEEAGPDD